MKVIVENDTNLSTAIAQDGDTVTLVESNLTINGLNGITYIYNYLNSSNSTLHQNVTVPDGWYPHKFTFDGEIWALNPDWVEPEAPVEEVAQA